MHNKILKYTKYSYVYKYFYNLESTSFLTKM